jgi:hypothetical protein
MTPVLLSIRFRKPSDTVAILLYESQHSRRFGQAHSMYAIAAVAATQGVYWKPPESRVVVAWEDVDAIATMSCVFQNVVLKSYSWGYSDALNAVAQSRRTMAFCCTATIATRSRISSPTTRPNLTRDRQVRLIHGIDT